LICKSDTISTYLNLAGDGVIVDTAGLILYQYDACGLVASPSFKSPMNCTSIGIFKNILEIQDNSANLAQCPVWFEVLDSIKPMLECADTVVKLYLDVSGEVNLQAIDLVKAATDNCSEIWSWIDTTFNCAKAGVQNLLIEVEDNSGNLSQCSVNVEVLDSIKPTITCVPSVEYLIEKTDLLLTDLLLSTSDNCGILATNWLDVDYICSDAGIQKTQISVKDNSGNMASCTVDVFVKDTLEAEITCLQNNLSFEMPDSGSVQLSVNGLATYNYLGCAKAKLELSDSLFNCQDIGNQQIFAQVIVVNDTFKCPISVEIKNDVLPQLFTDLKALYNSLGGANWTNQNGWDNVCSLVDIENMYGVILENGKLKSLDLSANNLKGSLDVNLLAPFTALKIIDLSSNDIDNLIALTSLGSIDSINLSDNNFVTFPDLSTITNKGQKVIDLSQTPFSFADVEDYFNPDGTSIFKDLILDSVVNNFSIDTITITQNDDLSYTYPNAILGDFNVYQWIKSRNNSLINSGLTLSKTDILLSDSGVYVLEVKNTRVQNTKLIYKKIYLKVNPLPYCTVDAKTLVSNASLAYCANEKQTFTVNRPDFVVDWTIKGTKTISPTFQTNEAGTLIVHATDNLLCDLRDTIVLTHLTPAPVPEFLMSSEGYLGEAVVAIDITYPVLNSFVWDFGTANVQNDDEGYLLTFNTLGTNTIKLISKNNQCSDTLSKSIEIKTNPNLKPLINPIDILEMSVSPNPTSGEITVSLELSNLGVIDFYIFNSKGELVETKSIDAETLNPEVDFDLSHYPQGVYVAKAVSNVGQNMRKLVLE
jgi:hypothetical protein